MRTAVIDVVGSPPVLSPGTIIKYAAATAPSGWLACDGSAISRIQYPSLFALLFQSTYVDKGTVTITIASPGVVTLSSHGFSTGDAIYLATTGSLPTGLVVLTAYYVHVINANSFYLAASAYGAFTGAYINTSGSQSGTHDLYLCAYGPGDGATTFNLPDFRGRVAAGYAASGGHADVSLIGKSDGTAAANRRAKHQHYPHGHLGWTYNNPLTSESSNDVAAFENFSISSSYATTSTDGGSGNTNDSLDAPAYIVLNRIIKT